MDESVPESVREAVREALRTKLAGKDVLRFGDKDLNMLGEHGFTDASSFAVGGERYLEKVLPHRLALVALLVNAFVPSLPPAVPQTSLSEKFGPEKREHRAKKLRPSSMDLSECLNVQRVGKNGEPLIGVPLFLNWRPEYACGMPASLMCAAFGKFSDYMSKGSCDTWVVPSPQDTTFLARLCEMSINGYNFESQRQRVIQSLFQEYIGLSIGTYRFPESYIECDGVIKHPFNVMPYAIFEYANELGSTKALKYFQGQGYYSHFMSDDMYKEHRKGNSPCFLVEIQGPYMRVSGLCYYKDTVHAMPLTEILYLCRYPSDEHIETLIRGCAALKKGILDVSSDYEASTVPFQSLSIPYSLFTDPQFSDIEMMGESFRVYRAKFNKQPAVVKFAQQYGYKVHKAWAEKGWAPEVYDYRSIPGGWHQVTMKHLDSSEGWSLLMGLSDEYYRAACRTVSKVLKLAQSLPIGEHCGVHGDIRPNNIMVNKEKVHFIDFDWAGEENTVRYPRFLNPKISWPTGAVGRSFILKEHDTIMLERLSKENFGD